MIALIAVSGLAVISGCDRASQFADEPFLLAKARAAVAFAEAEIERTSQQTEVDSQRVTTAPVTPRRRRLLYFTASWCATCRANGPSLEALRDAGWQIGPGEENHIQTVDLDESPDLARRYDVHSVPAWLLIDDGREVRRTCGVLDPFAIGRMLER